jgi:hypothetical protein
MSGKSTNAVVPNPSLVSVNQGAITARAGAVIASREEICVHCGKLWIQAAVRSL